MKIVFQLLYLKGRLVVCEGNITTVTKIFELVTKAFLTLVS